jgi:haloalkane dehalogenase
LGRSDKPAEREAYSFAGHARNLEALLDELDLRDVTMVVHDWGGPIGLVRAGTHKGLSDEVAAAYLEPFPTAGEQGGVHAFPELVPTDLSHPEVADHQRVWAALEADTRPALTLWAAHDLVFPVEQGRRFLAKAGLPEPQVVPDAGHFLQEDAGEDVAARIVRWLS